MTPTYLVAVSLAALLALMSSAAGDCDGDLGACPTRESARADVGDLESSSLLQERTRGILRPAQKPAYTAASPNPELLTWTKNPTDDSPFGVGSLKVPLDPFDANSPDLTLTVVMHFVEGQPESKPMLVHCGGPGSGAECAPGFVGAFGSQSYHLWSINQRGVGRTAQPSLVCSGAHLPSIERAEGDYAISDFTDCPCALPDGTPQIGETWADIDPDDGGQVRNLLEHVARRANPCYQSEKFQLQGKNGRIYNFLDYVGTQYLAHDIDVMRKAVGAPKMGIVGLSYGTFVGAVYASIFPQYTDRLVLNGNMAPLPQKTMLANGCAQSLQQAVDKFLYNCEETKGCAMESPVAEYEEILAAMRSGGGLTAPTTSGKPFRLQIGMLLGFLQHKLGKPGGGGWGPAMQTFSQLSPRRKDAAAREAAVAAILDTFCYVGPNQTKTWYEYGVCIGPGHVAEGESSFIYQAAIQGADNVGRYTVPSAVRAWESAKTLYGTAGASAFIGVFSGLFDWRVVPTPPPPLGNPSTPALIVGNLYDPSTEYPWSQQMHWVFPSSAMITYQGVGHLMMPGGIDSNATAACHAQVTKYLNSGELPVNGYICREENDIPVK